MKRALFSMTVLLLALLAAQNLAAQRKGSGVLNGVVLGPDDRPVPHASVSYQSSAGMAPHAVHTDSQGHFTITKLRTDNYDLRASGKGVFSEWDWLSLKHRGSALLRGPESRQRGEHELRP